MLAVNRQFIPEQVNGNTLAQLLNDPHALSIGPLPQEGAGRQGKRIEHHGANQDRQGAERDVLPGIRFHPTILGANKTG